MASALFKVKLNHIDTLTKQLEEYKKSRVQELMRQWLDAFCSSIAQYASDGYEGAVNVDYYETAPDHGGDCAYIVSANGDAVVFLEFGAGVDTDTSHDYAGTLQSQTGIAVEEGSYSRSALGSGQFANYGWWAFGGRYYRGIRPKRALLLAVQQAITDMGKKN